MKIQPALAALSLAFTSAVLAHPNHGTTDGHSLLHYLAEPLHVAVGVAAVVAFVATGYAIKRATAKKPAPQKRESRHR